MFDDIPVDIGIIYEGERIRGRDMQFELGGPREDHKFELVQSLGLDEIEDGKVEIVGGDMSDLTVGTNTPFGMVIYVAGKEIEKDLEGVIERRIHEYVNFIEGFMHLNQRYDIQLRLSKKSYEKGFNSFKLMAEVLMRLYKSEMPFIEKIQITFITEPGLVKDWYGKAMAGEGLVRQGDRDLRVQGRQGEGHERRRGGSLLRVQPLPVLRPDPPLRHHPPEVRQLRSHQLVRR